MQKDLSNHLINDLTVLKRKENMQTMGMTSIWQRHSKVKDPSIAANKFDKEKNNCSKAVWEQDSSVDPSSLLAENTILLRILVEVEGQPELLEIEGE